jgi:hypothetical protein
MKNPPKGGFFMALQMTGARSQRHAFARHSGEGRNPATAWLEWPQSLPERGPSRNDGP